MDTSSTFSRAVNEMYDEDVASYKKGGYISDRTLELSMICDLMMSLESISEETTIQEAA